MSKINHVSHGLADLTGHYVPGNLTRDGAPKRVTGIEVAHGHRSRSGGATIGPGYAKRTVVAQPVIGHRSRTSHHSVDLGEAILRTAFSRSDNADCVAHGRNPLDGSK